MIAELFDKAAQSYDAARRQLVPCFDDLYGTALQQIPRDAGAIRVLDIGAGTGLFTAFVAEVLPQAQLTLIDISPDMLAKAQERMQPYAERVEIKLLDMLAIDQLGSFDLVISALAIHHLDDAGKQQLFGKIFEQLKPGGRFVHVEQVLGPTPEIEAIYEQVWQETARAKGVSEADLQNAIERMKQDRSAPLITQLQWLEQAGFEQVNCWYQWYRFATYSAQKPAV